MQSEHGIAGQPVGPLCAGLPDPNPDLLGIIRDWAQKRGQDLPDYWEMTRPDEAFARYCADAYQQARHAPSEFRTLESYRALIAEIDEQFQLFLRAGYTFSLWRGNGQPYRNSQEMGAAARNQRHLFIYPTIGLPPDHPLAPVAMSGWSRNDVFRVVHDLVGHAATGFQFGPVGEENAFRFHATIHSAAAVPALAAETRLQNCWVNYGPHLRDAPVDGSSVPANRVTSIPPSTRPYAAQKAFLPVSAAVDCTLWGCFWEVKRKLNT